MPPVAGSMKLSIGGALPAGEIWRIGLWFDSGKGSGIAQSDVTTLATNAFSLWPTDFWKTTVRAKISTQASWNYMVAYGYAGGSSAAFEASDVVTASFGTDTSAPLPNQCSIVASLRTGLPGRSRRGRVYLSGLTTAALDLLGEVPQTEMDLFGQALALFLNDMHGTAGGVPSVVMSETLTAMTPLTSVTIDSRIDIQRRRANRQLISRSSNYAI